VATVGINLYDGGADSEQVEYNMNIGTLATAARATKPREQNNNKTATSCKIRHRI
jgi:hypothetical protein